MFAYIQGKLVHREATHAIVDVQGVGYFIKISLNTYSFLQQQNTELVRLHTYLQIQENAHNLFGFAELVEKKVFMELISVSGIGANTAIVMLSSLSPAEIQQAIVSEDVKTIQSIKGIGTKTAQRVILELKDKMRKGLSASDYENLTSVPTYRSVRDEALQALVVLGVQKNIAEKNIDATFKKLGNDINLEELIKSTLKM
jgi:holliday junction DNA helicase RuvA